MSNFALVWTETFERTAKKFLYRYPELAGLFEEVLLQLETEPHAPKLRLHRLKGKHRDKHTVSLTYSYRIVLFLHLEATDIILLDVGSHDEVYRK